MVELRRVRTLVTLVAVAAAALFATQLLTRADTVAPTPIPVGSIPQQAQLSPDGGKLLVSNELANTVSIISTASDTVAATIPVGIDPGPIRFLPDGSKAYVANFLDGTVSVINMSTNSLAATVPVGNSPITLTRTDDGTKVYSVNEESNTISVICTGKAPLPAGCSSPDMVVKTVNVGQGPWGVGANGIDPSDVAANPTTNRVYVANHGSKNVSVIDGATNSVIAMIKVGTRPRGVAVDPSTNRVFVSNETSNTVSVIDGATNSLITTVPVGNGPSGVGVDDITHRVYVTNLGTSISVGNTVSVIDETPAGADEHNVIAIVTVGTGPSSVGVNHTTHRVYVSNNGTSMVAGNTVSVIDGDPISGTVNTVIGTVTVGNNPRGVGVNPVTNRVYVANGGTTAVPGNTVSIVDDSTNPPGVTSVTVGSGPSRVGVNPTTNRIYVSNNFGPGTTVSVINGATGAILGSPITVGNGASGVAVNPTTNRIYVGNKVSDNLSVIDGASASVTATVWIGSSPHSIAKSPDGSKAYVANQLSNTVTVINTATDAVVANIAVGSSPGSIHFTPDGSKAYVSNRGCADSFECSPLLPPTISVINPATNSVTTTISTGVGVAGAAPHSMRITPDGSKLYVVNKHTNEVKVISTATNAVTTTIPITTGLCSDPLNPPGDPARACPVRVELTADGSRAYVVDEAPTAASGSVSVICTGLVLANCGGFTADTVMATLAIGNKPVDIEINCLSRKAYVTNSGSSSVSVIDLTGMPACPDSDGDTVPDAVDNCPTVANGPAQASIPGVGNQTDSDSDGLGDACDPDDDNDGYWDTDESAKGSNPRDAASKPEHCDGVDNDGDTAIDEAPTGANWNIDLDTVKDCFDTNVDTDGDGTPNSLDGTLTTVDSDDDGDGFTDAQERKMSTDELGNCSINTGQDAWPPDRTHDGFINIGDVISAFLGKILNPKGYDARSDAAGDGDNDIGDVIQLFGGKILTKCVLVTRTNNTGGAVDDIHIVWSAAIAEVFSARDSNLKGWSNRTISGGGLTLDMDRPDVLGDLASGGQLTVVVRGSSPVVSSCQWTLDGFDKGPC